MAHDLGFAPGDGDALNHHLMRAGFQVGSLLDDVGHLRSLWMPGKIGNMPLPRGQRADLFGRQREETQPRVGPFFAIDARVIALLLLLLVLFRWFIGAGKGNLTASW